ncbi:CDP-glucose 4,6-dehydratase [Alloacidobacterium dinghuense]|uniref:CDP-glucose 4,6-dehydratase n=1 Tax=Alloacidobacterium dinghuense TaxID=2763107 RepID=A0A7G8BLT9_9BACT|nr:CDP-glucose 4,6-dehydratase [Alloacidobacterium dinghuense]QNI33509.1 CDP-glucose 4,6-dehydratase [Alloacidobacterium dinghuense]
MTLNRSFWKGRRVFLTGHTGFKGSWLSLWLHSLGAEVTGYALDPPTEPNLFTQARVAGCIRCLRGDIRDYPALKKAIAECRPEVVLHMAAQSVVRTSYENPVENYATNVMGTVHVFEAVRELGRACVIVNVTSDKCYENREWVWGYRESEPMGGKDPYSNSKACSELVTSAYRESFFSPETIEKHGIALGSARAGNAIGGGDWTPHQLIPDLIRAFTAGEPCLIRNPLSYRPWQFALEPLRGYLILAERLSEDALGFASGWNFGPVDADVQPVSWIADTLVRFWGDGAAWQLDSGSHPHEARALKLDASKAGAFLNWRPALSLAEALAWIVQWYRGLQQGSDMRELTLAQIQRYEALIGMTI